MLDNDSVRPAGDGTGLTTRRRLLGMTAAIAAAVPASALLGAGTAQATPGAASGRIRQAVLVPRLGGDPSSDWYPWLSRQLAGLGVRLRVVPLQPQPDAPTVDAMVATIARALGNNPGELADTLLIGHSVGSRSLLAYLDRHGAGRTFAGMVSVAGWSTVDDLTDYPVLVPWVNLDLDVARIASAVGTLTVHLSDNDPFTADWRANATQWLSSLGASVHITHGAGHFMTTDAAPVLDTVRAAWLAGHDRSGDRILTR